MNARVSENRSRLVLAEADVPRALAEAFKAGRIGNVVNGATAEGSA